MKSPRMVGHGLAVFLPGLAGWLAFSEPSARAPMQPRATEVSARHVEFADEASSLFSAPMEEVRLAIQPGLVADPADVPAYLHDVLSRLYGQRLSESSAMAYMIEWVEGKPVLVCHGEETFEISFGAHGTVRVAARSTMQVPR